MRTIWKFKIPLEDEPMVSMPEGAEVLHVGVQGGALVAWASVDTRAKPTPHRFQVVGTGDPLPDRLGFHAGSAQMGRFVWHVFWSPEESDHGN